jgi:hypothetical protein
VSAYYAPTEVPAEVAEWFSGEAEAPPWALLLAPGWLMRGRWWAAWRKEHPEAVPTERVLALLPDEVTERERRK